MEKADMVGKQLLVELKLIIEEDYGVSLKDSQIKDVGECLVGCFDIMAKVINQNENKYEKTQTA